MFIRGEVVHGNTSSGAWQVQLERKEESNVSKVKLGRGLQGIQDLLETDEVGPLRDNRVVIHGITRAATLRQGLVISEADDVAVLAVGAAISNLSKWRRQVVSDSSNETQSYSREESVDSKTPSHSNQEKSLVPVKARIMCEVIALWWGCSSAVATKLLELGEKILVT